MKSRISMMLLIGCLVGFPIFAGGKGKKSKKAPKPASAQQRSRVPERFDSPIEKGKETVEDQNLSLVYQDLLDQMKECFERRPEVAHALAIADLKKQNIALTNSMNSVRRWVKLTCLISSSVLFCQLYNLYFGKENTANNQTICPADLNANDPWFPWMMKFTSVWGKPLFNGLTLSASIASLGINTIIYWDKIKNFLHKFA